MGFIVRNGDTRRPNVLYMRYICNVRGAATSVTRCLVQRAERDSKEKCMETGYKKQIPLRIRVFLFRLSLCTPILIHDVALAVPHLRPGVLCSLRALARIHTYGPLTKRRSVKRDLTMDSPFHPLRLFYHPTVP